VPDGFRTPGRVRRLPPAIWALDAAVSLLRGRGERWPPIARAERQPMATAGALIDRTDESAALERLVAGIHEGLGG